MIRMFDFKHRNKVWTNLIIGSLSCKEDNYKILFYNLINNLFDNIFISLNNKLKTLLMILLDNNHILIRWLYIIIVMLIVFIENISRKL